MVGKMIKENKNLFPSVGLTDPHVLVEGNRVYLYMGHDESWDTSDTWRMDKWVVKSTEDFVEWRDECEILPQNTYIGNQPNCWACNIHKHNGKYYLYVSNKNINTGVLVSDSPQGPFVDVLNKPLLEQGLAPVPVYDPTVFEENGTCMIFFGSGQYYAVELAEDRISTIGEPQLIEVFDKSGNIRSTADKSTVFKRNDIYYLAWGEHYATSKNLLGPYIYQGGFLAGGHNDVFCIENDWYAVIENKDIGLFFRGIALKRLNFDDHGLVVIPPEDSDFPGSTKKWDFSYSSLGWKAIEHTSLEWNQDNGICGIANGEGIIQSTIWPSDEPLDIKKLVIQLKNETNAKQLEVSMAFVEKKGKFWDQPELEWEQERKFNVDITPNMKVHQMIEILIDENFKEKNLLLRCIRIQLKGQDVSGKWSVKAIETKENYL